MSVQWPNLAPYAAWWGTIGIILGIWGIWLGYRFEVLGRKRGRWFVGMMTFLVGISIPWAIGFWQPDSPDEWFRRFHVLFLLVLGMYLGAQTVRVRDLEAVARFMEREADDGPDA